LTTWAKNYQAPQAIVFGIIGMAIIGPTLGMIKKRKKKRGGMRVILAEIEAKRATKQVFELAQHASTALLGNELAAVNGNAYRLDPELAEWLFVDQETRLFTGTNLELATLAKLLKHDRLPHFVLKNDKGIQAIAVAPAVSDELETGTAL